MQATPQTGAENPASAPPAKKHWLSPLNRRRWQNFRRNRLGYWSLWVFLFLFVATSFAEFLANDRPIVAMYKGELLFPVFVHYPETHFDGGFLAVTQYRDPFIQREIASQGWMLWPPVRFSYQTSDRYLPMAAPVPPAWMMEREQLCRLMPLGVDDPNCVTGNFHWLGTDDQGRDVMARVIYGFRISVLFGLILTIFSSIVGVIAGAVQGFFGGWTDLLFQRFIEVWVAIPSLYLLLIITSVIAPSFWVLLGILLALGWVTLVGVVRAEVLRARNFEYVNAARALGVSNRTIMFQHLLPNAMVATMTFMPFIMAGSVTTLTSLDFLGFGLPPGSPSLGELLLQGKNNVSSPWLGLTGFIVLSVMLTLMVFIGNAMRDAFDPRKTFS